MSAHVTSAVEAADRDPADRALDAGRKPAELLTFFGIVLSAVRWQKVLNALGLRARTTHLLNLYLACQFVSNVLPTTMHIAASGPMTRGVGALGAEAGGGD